MPLKDIVRKKVISCSPQTSIFEVSAIMKENEVGTVLVVEKNKPVGIVTDRDLVTRCLAASVDPSILNAEDVMTAAVETVTESEGLYDVVQKMRRAWIRRVVVVDEKGEAQGLLSFDDVFELIADEIGALREVIQPREPKLENVA